MGTTTKKEEKKDLICTTHGKIAEIADYLMTLNLRDLSIDGILKEEEHIQELGSYLNDLTEYALERGQSMEDRLQEYFNAISELGFERKK